MGLDTHLNLRKRIVTMIKAGIKKEHLTILNSVVKVLKELTCVGR